jgi:uncharacterized protein
MSWSLTATGKAFEINNPKFYFEDIAIALAKMPRYNGHTRGWLHYSVAEHSYLMAKKAMDETQDRGFAWACLMHDASEAYLSDIVRPIKSLIPDYLAVEKALQKKIEVRYGVDKAHAAAVKDFDNRILHDECIQIMSATPEGYTWGLSGSALGVQIMICQPQRAYELFVGLAEIIRPDHVDLNQYITVQ